MDDLIRMTEWLKNDKGITKLTLEELLEFEQEYELYKQKKEKSDGRFI